MNKSHFFATILIFFICGITFIYANQSFFDYLTDQSIELNQDFNFMVTVIHGDSRLYYSLEALPLITEIMDGILNKSVDRGSILSYIGISIYVSAANFTFVPIEYSIFFLNLCLLTLFSYKLMVFGYKGIWKALILFPLTFNYLLIPNKELFAVFLIAILSVQTRNKYLKSAWLNIFRDPYLAVWLSSFLSRITGLFITLLIISIIIPFIIPDTYYTNTAHHVTLNQRSSTITLIAHQFLQIPILSIIGISIKFILGMFSAFFITFESLNFLKLQYILCALINFYFILKLMVLKNFRFYVMRSKKPAFNVMILFAIYLSLAPGNPARFLAPLTFFYLILLIDYSQKSRSH